ncbi:MAG: hypothetical protein ACTSU5_14530 [Promethearchaeota archaeon]
MSQYDDYDDEELVKITKFQISHNLTTLAILHRDTREMLYRYDSPMSRVHPKIFEGALIQAEKLDLLYGELKALQHPEGYTIIILEGNYVQAIVILNKEGFTPLISKFGETALKEFLDDFENEYYKILREWTGDSSVFSNITEILDKSLGLRMNLPHQARYQGFEPESATERTVFEAADKVTRKIGYFYLSNLIGITKRYVIEKEEEKERYSVEPRKRKKKKKGKSKKKKGEELPPELLDAVPGTNIVFPPDEDFYIAFFNLVKLGLLQAIPIKELDSYSKIDYN